MLNDVFEPFRTAVAGQYAIKRQVGQGGMATVFLAEDLNTTAT